MSSSNPPFEITSKTTDLLVKIGAELARIEFFESSSSIPYLRRKNRIKTIQASLEIEQNSLSVEQVTAIIAGKHVHGRPIEITEVQNAFSIYEQLEELNPFSQEDLLKAHSVLMNGLVGLAGQWRAKGVGVVKGKGVVHMASPAENVPYLMNELLSWLRNTDTHPLIASSVFHYELEFIHPFADGNGRMGRLWQSVILSHWNQAFSWLPIETLIRDNQQEYYDILAACDNAGSSTLFVEFIAWQHIRNVWRSKFIG